MKKIILLLVVCFTYIGLDAQTIVYSYDYDDAGNRTLRAEISFSSADGESFQEMENLNLEGLENLEDYIGEQNLKIYPNPTRGEMALKFENFPEENTIKLQFYDNTGKILIDKDIAESFYVLDINHHPAGNYLLRLQLGNHHKVYQIVKQ